MAPTAASFLGIDVGRDALGLVVLSSTGEIKERLTRSYSSQPSAVVDPQDWWRAARTGIKEILRRGKLQPEQIRSIGVTGESSGFAAVDRAGEALCPAVLGPDPAAEPFCAQLVRTVGARNLLNLAGGMAHSGAVAVKLLQLRETQKRAWHDLAMILPPKDFLRLRLTGVAGTCGYDASATLLCSPKARSWSKMLLQQLDFNPAWLPQIGAATSIAGRVTPDAARESGLHPGTPVVIGAPHVAASAIALGISKPGQALVQLGGDGAIFIPTPDAVRDPLARLSSHSHSLADQWALAMPGLASDSPILWLAHEVLTADLAQARRSKRDPLDVLAELAAEVPPGADGLVFRCPGRATEPGFAGLGWHHQRGHLVRAILESAALAIRLAIDAAAACKRRPERLTATGPCASNHLWCQIVADASGLPLDAHPANDRDALGAALLAAVAVGSFKDLAQGAAKTHGKPTTYLPRRAATEAYEALLPRLAPPPPPATETFFADNPT